MERFESPWAHIKIKIQKSKCKIKDGALPHTPLIMDDDFYMAEALKEARKAFDKGEVPVGAVVLYKNKVIARAYNQMELLKDATAHAEILAITQASSFLNNWRLKDTTIYVTKEPCPMCAGAMVNSRVKRLVFGVFDKEMGAGGSVIDLVKNNKLRHQLEIKSGVKEEECRNIIQEFFKRQRLRNKVMDN